MDSVSSIVPAFAPARPAGARSVCAFPHRSGLKGDFDLMTFRPRPGCIARRPLAGELPALVARVAAALGVDLADCALIDRVAAADPDSVWVFDCGGRAAGGFAFLFLTAEGVARMLDGRLDMRAPELRFLAHAGERPEGVYLWALLARGRAAAALPQVLAMLRGPRFCEADLWAAPVTRDGERFVENLGFVRAPGTALPNLRHYPRRASAGGAS